jgi:hypothetical protein
MENPFSNNGKGLLNFLLDKKRENSIHSYISIKNALLLFDIPCLIITIQSGTTLFRCRWHDKKNQYFIKINDLSFREDMNNINAFGRVNEPVQSIFYCANQRETALFEVSKIQKGKGNIEIEDVTYGEWILQKDLICAHLPLVKENIGKNPIADYLHRTFEENVNKYSTDETVEWRNLFELIALEFSRETNENDQGYLISCAFSHYLFTKKFYDFGKKKELYIDGIMYPSVKYSEEGMNIAIQPQFIIEGSMILNRVVRQRMERIESATYKETDTQIATEIDYKNGIIKW